MNARFVREGVHANDGLVRLNRDTRVIGDETAGTRQLLRLDIRGEIVEVLTGIDRHDDFFKRGVTCPFANAVNRDFGLTCARQQS